MRKRRSIILKLLGSLLAGLLFTGCLLSNGTLFIRRHNKTLRLDLVSSRVFPPREDHAGPFVDRGRSICASNLKQLWLAARMYAQDNDGYLPRAQFPDGTHGWSEQLTFYTKALQTLHCPQQSSTHAMGNPRSRGYTDYWLNSNLSGARLSAIAAPQAFFLFGEGNDGLDLTDASYNKKSIPANWLIDTAKPPWRHLEAATWADAGANYSYADGHVKWLRPREVGQAVNESNPFANP